MVQGALGGVGVDCVWEGDDVEAGVAMPEVEVDLAELLVRRQYHHVLLFVGLGVELDCLGRGVYLLADHGLYAEDEVVDGDVVALWVELGGEQALGEL